MAKPKLTAEVRKLILAYIRSGGFPIVAAEACGVDRDTFRRWMRLGRNIRSGVLFKSFYTEVMKARASARLMAEVQAYRERPIDWLKAGPGNPTQATEIWSTVARPPAEDTTPNDPWDTIDTSPMMTVLIQTVLRVLEPYPEIRIQMASVLAKEAEIEPKEEGETEGNLEEEKPTPETPPTPLPNLPPG